MNPNFLSRLALLPAVAFFFFLQNISAQNISFQLPDDFAVCGTGQFGITVTNGSANALTGVEVTVDFNTSSGTECGVAYLENTVSGAGEADVSNLEMPVFSVSDLAAGAAATFTFEAEAPCSVAGCIDGGEIFINEATLNWNGGSTSLVSDPFNIERALLVITGVEQELMSGTQGDVLLRKITIVNSRPGALQSFLFTDTHQGGIEISSDLGTVISPPGGNTFQLSLTASDFATIGDGDGLFELNETICITEEISITSCGVNLPSTISNLTAGWGCGGDICQEVTVNAIITIAPSTKVPELIFQPLTNTADCFCGPNGFEQGMVITNIGEAEATEINLEIFHGAPQIQSLIEQSSIRVDSAGVDVPFALSSFTPTFFEAPCIAPDSLLDYFSVLISELGAGESLTVFFDFYFCNEQCSRPEVEWRYKYNYLKPCPPNPFVDSGPTAIEVFAAGAGLDVTLATMPLPPMLDDSTYTMSYELNYDSLNLLDDTLLLEIVLPCGMAWVVDNDLVLGGQSPFFFEVAEGDTFTVITANYLLPFGGNTAATEFDFVFDCESLCLPAQVCEDSLETTCPVIEDCTIEIPKTLGLSITTTLLKCDGFPLGCNLQDCAIQNLLHECPLDSLCIEQPPGYVNYEFESVRGNYGLADDNNDRLPDGTGPANLALVERHRIMPGDTIHGEVHGEVVMDIPGSTLPFGNVTFNFFASDMSNTNRDNLLTNLSGIEEAGVDIRIFDASANSYFDCADATPIIDDENGLRYVYDLETSALGDCLPADFEFAEGDSIIAVGDFRVVHNLTPDGPPDPNPLLGSLVFRPDMQVFDQDTSLYEPISCGCAAQIFELTGYRYNLLPGQYGIPGCGPSQFIGGSVFTVDLHEGNFFPFEYRNLITALDWTLEIPPDVEVELLEAKLTFLNYQGGIPITNNVPLTWAGDNPYVIDFGQYQLLPEPLDEGFSALFQYIFAAECDIFGASPITFSTTLDFAPNLPEAEDPLVFSLTSNSLRGMVPNLSANAVLCDLTSFNDQLVFDFSFANFPTLVASQSSGAAPNTWMYVSSPSGLVSGFELIDPVTGTSFPIQNGVWQLGDFPIDTIALQLVGQNNSCELENLELHYGWNCDPFTSQVQTPCYERVKPLSIFSPPGEIDFILETPTTCADLCDTVDYHTLEIFNAQLGAVYGLTASGLLPPGLTVLPGTSEVEYPTGSGQFFPLPDPVVMPGGVVTWPLGEQFANLAAGLPGIGSAPQNSITLRFLSATSCGFVAGAFSLFAISAEQVCGIPSNTVAKAGDPVCINGVSQPYSTNITLEPEAPFGCSDVMNFDLSLTASEDLPEGACVIVSLPEGVEYVAGSCSPICQANFDCTPTVDGGTVTWNLPEGVAQGQIVCFQFSASGWNNLSCEQGVILVRSANEALAFCAATGDDCSTKVQTGSTLVQYDIMRPEFVLENFTINATSSGGNDLIDFSIHVVNEGAPNEPPITLDFYLDTNGDGSGDDLVHTENVVAVLASGQTEIVTGSFSIPSGNLCNLIAYLDPTAQCACAADSATVNVPIAYQTGQAETVCSEEEIQVGVAAMPGFTYQWSPDGCLADAQSASTVFSCANDGAAPLTFDFTLSETDGGNCEIENLISVTVQPMPGIAFADSPICQGQPANLAATPGVDYQWSGPDVVQNQQFQTVFPFVSTTYSVTVTDDEGCSGSESIDIVVNPTPTADAGPDINVCPGELAQLNAPNVPGVGYLWSPANVGGAPALSDPTIPNPIVLTSQTTSFTLELTNAEGCTATDIAVVDFNGNIDLILPADLTVCLGSSATLNASGADSYVWSGGTCLDPPACASIEVMPTETTTYTVAATTDDGCAATGSVTVTVSEDEIVIPLNPIQICTGEVAIIFGEEVSVPGMYLDTIPSMMGDLCDTIFSQNLLAFPVIDTTFSDSTICEGDSVFFENMFVSSPGLTCVSYAAGPGGCDSTLCLDLTVLGAPPVTLTIEPDTLGEPGTAIELSIEPTTYDSIVWTGGGIVDECLNLPECADILGETDTLYMVTVFDGICSNTATQLFNVSFECDPMMAEVPNVFTPNGDEYNNEFTLVAQDAARVIDMKIWNRWGQKVYEGAGPWDGTQGGDPAASDVYIYVIEIGCPVQVEDVEERVVKGDVTLLR